MLHTHHKGRNCLTLYMKIKDSHLTLLFIFQGVFWTEFSIVFYTMFINSFDDSCSSYVNRRYGYGYVCCVRWWAISYRDFTCPVKGGHLPDGQSLTAHAPTSYTASIFVKLLFLRLPCSMYQLQNICAFTMSHHFMYSIYYKKFMKGQKHLSPIRVSLFTFRKIFFCAAYSLFTYEVCLLNIRKI
jgi:hypothetical protein